MPFQIVAGAGSQPAGEPSDPLTINESVAGHAQLSQPCQARRGVVGRSLNGERLPGVQDSTARVRGAWCERCAWQLCGWDAWRPTLIRRPPRASGSLVRVTEMTS